MTEHFTDIAARYERELLDNVVPFWEQHGLDREYGGYFNSLARDGAVFDTEKFLWMQWRLVYMFATLYSSEYRQERWLAFARHGYDFLTRHGKDAHGHYYFALNRAGEPTMAPFSMYSDCFAAMGAAALYKATGEPAYRTEAETDMAHYCARIDHPKGRWEKALPGKPARRTLGHYMMLANLGYVLNECLDTTHYEADIRQAAATVLEMFWHPERRVLFENVNLDGAFDLASYDGRHVNPGHGLEAMWFILQYAAQAGDAALAARACEVVHGLLDFGWDHEHGGLFYFMDVLGLPHLELQWDMKLWWVHNEALLAALYAYQASHDDVFLDWFHRLDAWTWAHFPDPAYGEWFAYLNRRGEPTHTLKGGKWKCCFHLPRCLLFGTRLLRKLAEENRR